MSLILHAPNVHQGGGLTLLVSLLPFLPAGSTAILDERFPHTALTREGVRALRVKPTLFARLSAERRLRSLATSQDTVLCFGNLPPLLRQQARVVVFLQNCLLVNGAPLHGYPWRVRLRLAFERRWLAWGMRHANQVVVQTTSMQSALAASMGRRAEVVPFGIGMVESLRASPPIEAAGPRRYDFVYVASGEPHKNHARLLAAWELLAAEGLYPSLCLTIPETGFATLNAAIQRSAVEHGLRIENRGALAPDTMREVYRQSRALIYPSLLESFGLPLIEARAMRLPVVAAEIDYVRDVVDPEQTFDPRSPVSIARAVKRFLGVAQGPPEPIDGEAFLAWIRGCAK